VSFNSRFAIKPSAESYDALSTGRQVSQGLCEQSGAIEESPRVNDQASVVQSTSKLDADKVSVAAAAMLLIFGSYPAALTLGVVGDFVMTVGNVL
jgi:hypothetical protein